jgi:hypothetical protein
MLMLLALRLSSLFPQLVSSTCNPFLTIFVHLNLPAGKRRRPRQPIFVILKLLIQSKPRSVIDISARHLAKEQRVENVSFLGGFLTTEKSRSNVRCRTNPATQLSLDAWLASEVIAKEAQRREP